MQRVSRLRLPLSHTLFDLVLRERVTSIGRGDSLLDELDKSEPFNSIINRSIAW